VFTFTSLIIVLDSPLVNSPYVRHQPHTSSSVHHSPFCTFAVKLVSSQVYYKVSSPSERHEVNLSLLNSVQESEIGTDAPKVSAGR